ncbi:protein arginine methyltransferase NDUFAF7 homolog, mitochondrial [Pistacia vera]|uniref:protein arginine methyltransferase NDUFAF7 homolog, mitochondrial n=1 Tax=Pistacia vera TaxID=55513 RepID=UPI001262B670|nr:protein arginine methyltransferase NDUFAF7 homolog, mitochondrial [Pistacia vera]
MLFRTLPIKKLHLFFNKPTSITPITHQSQLLSPQFQALFSTHIVGDTPLLVRDFIHSALYDPTHGYFSQRSRSVGVLETSIKFHQLQGRKAYMKHLDKIYKQSDISWFTPVELFKPWYAHGIAGAIMRTANLSVPLKIYEIGGGSGTCAKGIMDYLKLNAPERVYNNMTYISVEISPSLAEIQKETVGQVHSHSSKFRVECRDAADRSGWGDVMQQPCWVIMLEVLDNLPHDLIYSENQVSPWLEVWVEKQHDREALSELYKPLNDPLITRCIEIMEFDKSHTTQSSSLLTNIWSKVFPKPRRCWLPTGCLKLLDVLHEAVPKMSLIASDFSFLPDVKVPGERAPLVSTKKDGRSKDYSNYLDAKGDADIFFPTDFWLLERIDHYCSGWLKMQKDKSSKQGKKRRTITLDTCSFMEEFGLPAKTRTKDGYNPLLDDFKNTKFYLSVPTHNTK